MISPASDIGQNPDILFLGCGFMLGPFRGMGSFFCSVYGWGRLELVIDQLNVARIFLFFLQALYDTRSVQLSFPHHYPFPLYHVKGDLQGWL